MKALCCLVFLIFIALLNHYVVHVHQIIPIDSHRHWSVVIDSDSLVPYHRCFIVVDNIKVCTVKKRVQKKDRQDSREKLFCQKSHQR